MRPDALCKPNLYLNVCRNLSLYKQLSMHFTAYVHGMYSWWSLRYVWAGLVRVLNINCTSLLHCELTLVLIFRYTTTTAAEPRDLTKGLNPLSPMYITHWSSRQRGYRGVPALTQKDLNLQLRLQQITAFTSENPQFSPWRFVLDGHRTNGCEHTGPVLEKLLSGNYRWDCKRIHKTCVCLYLHFLH